MRRAALKHACLVCFICLSSALTVKLVPKLVDVFKKWAKYETKACKP